MNTNPLKKGLLPENSADTRTVTRKMLRARAVELATIDGGPAGAVSKVDWEQAKSELLARSDPDLTEAILESASESARWDPVHGSTGHRVPSSVSEDEDEEGRSDNERLVDEGMAGAERDRMRQAGQKTSQ